MTARLPAPPAPLGEQDDVAAHVVTAALRCIETAGFEQTTIDDIVRASGVPRTTIYRKIGGREAILSAVLRRTALRYHARCAVAAARPGGFAERVEAVTIASVTHIDDYPWLQVMLREGMSLSRLALLESVTQSLPSDVVRLVLQEGIRIGAWAPPAPLDEVIHWLIRQILMLGADSFADQQALRRHVRAFILPVFERAPSAVEGCC